MPNYNQIIISGSAPVSPPEKIGWMEMIDIAYDQACKASVAREVPVGAALFSATGELISKGHNCPVESNDPTAHAEINCLRNACEKTKNYRVPEGSILAVTLEPCIMCFGAIIHARVAGVVFGASDPRAGAIVSNLNQDKIKFLNHKIWAIGGISEKKCRQLLQSFFLRKRK